MDVVGMRARFKLIFLVILIICVGFYFLINQLNKDEDMDQTVQQENDPIENIEETDEHDEDDNVEEEELKTKVSNLVKDTFDFIFTKEFHVVAIGDSLTQGVGDSNMNGDRKSVV